MNELSQIAMRYLIAAGWSKNRVVDVTEFESRLKSDGYEISMALRSFYRAYGNLIIQTRAFGFIHIDGMLHTAAEWILEDYSPRVGEILAPFGEWQSYVLCMGPSGKVYGGMDNWLVWIADSGEGMIQKLCVMATDETKVISEKKD